VSHGQGGGNQEFRQIGPRDRRVTVTLDCGCRVKARCRPMNPKTTYPCPSGVGHGYQVGWVRWTEDQHHGENPTK
jgi:hypothetical protein